MPLAPIAAVEYLEATRPLPGNYDLGMVFAEFDLPNRPASGIDLPENYRCAARRASRGPAGTRIAASPDLDGSRERIEVRLERSHDRCPRNLWSHEIA